MDEEKKDFPKSIVFIENKEEGPITVNNYDVMLNLLDEGWVVKEEINGDIFIMIKTPLKPEDPSAELLPFRKF